MRLAFVETDLFADTAAGVLDDEALRAVQTALLADPRAGDVVPGACGARKVRVASVAGRGKSGGARVLYVYVEARARVFLLLAYPKSVADNVSAAGKKVLCAYIRRIAREGGD